MKSITFACTKSAEQIEKEANQSLTFYKIVPWLCIVCMGLIAYMYFSICDMGAAKENGSRDIVAILIFGMAFLFMLLIAIYFFYYKNRAGIKYILMPDKQFGWDEEAKQFFYKDKNRSLRFTGKDVEKWSSYIMYKTNIPIDIFLLKTGERLVLEGDWNEEVHDYLQNFHNLLDLPKPSGMAWMLDVYKDEPTPDMR
jgi:hypothetical protein